MSRNMNFAEGVYIFVLLYKIDFDEKIDKNK